MTSLSGEGGIYHPESIKLTMKVNIWPVEEVLHKMFELGSTTDATVEQWHAVCDVLRTSIAFNEVPYMREERAEFWEQFRRFVEHYTKNSGHL